jgi:dihydroorotase
MAFEEAGVDLGTAEGQALLERFLCLNGPGFYGFPASEKNFQMEKAAQQMTLLDTPAGPVTPLPVGMGMELTWRVVA